MEDYENIMSFEEELEETLKALIEKNKAEGKETTFYNGKPMTSLNDIHEFFIEHAGIKGKNINQENLDRLNKANMLACALFDPKEIDFNAPHKNLVETMCSVTTDLIDFDNKQEMIMYREFISIIDSFSVSSTGDDVLIQYSVDGVWEE